MKNPRLMLILAGIILSFRAHSQTVMYDVTVAGRVVGSVKVILFDAGAKTVK